MNLLTKSRLANFSAISDEIFMYGGGVAGGIAGALIGSNSLRERRLAAAEAYHPMKEKRFQTYQRTGNMPNMSPAQQAIEDNYNDVDRQQTMRTIGGYVGGVALGSGLTGLGLGLARKWSR